MLFIKGDIYQFKYLHLKESDRFNVVVCAIKFMLGCSRNTFIPLSNVPTAPHDWCISGRFKRRNSFRTGSMVNITSRA